MHIYRTYTLLLKQVSNVNVVWYEMMRYVKVLCDKYLYLYTQDSFMFIHFNKNIHTSNIFQFI